MNDGDVVIDHVLDGRVALRQPARGHRAGTDAVLLAASVRLEPGDRLVDVGAGVGTVGLILALRDPGLSGHLLEADPGTASLARENTRLNAVEARLSVVDADLFDPPARRSKGLLDEQATLIVTNPPFYVGDEARVSPDARKAKAHVVGHGTSGRGHGDWLRGALALLAPKGRLFMIHRPEALPALLSAGEGRLGGITVVPVHAKADGPAVRILLSGRKGSRAPLRIERGLTLHDAAGRFTAEAESLHRGEVLRPDTR